MTQGPNGLYILLISVHGLIRSHNLELGRDADTGGQIKYVVELARALGEHPAVDRVDLLTRMVIDPKVDPDYAEPEEAVGDNVYIIRLPCGPRRYLRKEVLWPYLDSLADHALQHLRRVGRIPDVIHGHYADAGYVGSRLAGLLGVPLIFTGHSLGREKQRRLRDQGMKPETIERQYNIARRIEAEEFTLDNAAWVVASTHQEVEAQYGFYDNYQPERMVVIPPGTNVERFHPPGDTWSKPPIYHELARFLRKPRKPMILALSRADPRKNLATLVKAYGENNELRAAANLVLIAGNRDDLDALEKGPRRVLLELMVLIDRYDLYGRVAYPKRHEARDVPSLYRLAAETKGVFINPALTEPFGLTLIEAAASGLPVVATEDGGPRDIMAACDNGLLVDPLDADGLGEALLSAIQDRERWHQWSTNGVAGAHRHYTWRAHVDKYLDQVNRVLAQRERGEIPTSGHSKLPVTDRVLVCDLDQTLLGDRHALDQLLALLADHSGEVSFGVATGRYLGSTLAVLGEWQVPDPDLIIASAGSEIYYGPQLAEDASYRRHIAYRWKPEAIRKAMAELPGLTRQPEAEQSRYKISYFLDPDQAPSVQTITRHLRKQDLHTKVVRSHGIYLDVLPVRASKGDALRYFAMKWGIPIERILTAGDSGNDEEMLSGNTLGVVVGNHSPDLEHLKGRDRVYFAEGHYARGVLEGIEYYDFFGAMGEHHKGPLDKVS